ncbi:hypothetical protein [Nocardia terpenica]|uniref:ESX-1 secretion-associated protein n=1 Tax=Nocardia terpenica TaxID=455432 RepID=A0A6G9Z0E1_9NOCA|nr:hypothetical protein [Nocardia terpenica]QIS18900.1 hypothetical protein F6W96_11950 [Nocardia terpenica]
MALLKADADQIKALATTLDDVAAKVDAIDVRTPSKPITSALPGTPLGAACDQATEYTEGAWLRVSQRIGQVSAAMKQTAQSLTATEEDFKKRLTDLNFHTPRGGGR